MSEAITGERITVSAPFFNKWMLPIGLVLLTLTGIGPLLAWRKSTIANLKDQFLWPVVAGVVVAATFVALGFRIWISGICFALCGLVLGTIIQEFWRGANVRKGATGTDILTALIGLVGRNKRRYGGYIVHAGIVLIFFGFAGEGFKKKEMVILKPGQQVTVGVVYRPLRRLQDDRRQFEAGDDRLHEGVLRTARKWRRSIRRSGSGTSARTIRRPLKSPSAARSAEDLYIVLNSAEAATQAASFEIVVNPLVNWLWMGFGIVAIGTIISLLPERAFSFALARLPAEAAATTAALVLALVLGTAPVANAQGGEEVRPQQKSPLQQRLEGEVMCTCGGCRLSVANCGMMNCHGRDGQQAKIVAHIDRGQGSRRDRQRVRRRVRARTS